MKTIQPLAALLVASPLMAQVVSPAHFATAEGPSWDASYVSGTATPSHVLQIHDDVPAGTIRGLAFRRDGGFRNSYRASTLICDIEISNAATTSASPNANFAANHGSNKVKVASFSIISMPATDTGASPAPFDFKFPFTTPFSFNGQGSLCIDINVRSRANAVGVPFDVARNSSTNPRSHVKYWGTGCRYATNRGNAFINGSSSPDWRNNSMTWTYSGNNMPVNTVATMILGATTKTVGGIPLPFELPGTASAPSRACTLYTDAVLTLPILTQANGTFSQTLGFQVQPFFNGGSLYAQAIGRAAGANSFGVVLTNVVEHNLVAPYTNVPVSSVRANNAGPSGAIVRNFGMVTQIN